MGSRSSCLVLMVILCLATQFNASAEQVGTAVVNGRIVILESDGTWRYKDDDEARASSNCDTVHGLELCLADAGWSKITQPGGDFAVSYAKAGRYYFGLIHEGYGKKDGYTYNFLQDAILANAAAAGGVQPKDVPILDTKTDVAAFPGFRSITYNPTLNGTPFVFHNLYKIYEDKAIQMVFWGLGKSFSADFRTAVDGALQAIEAQ